VADEAIIDAGSAIWRDYPYATSPEDSEGSLELTGSGLTFTSNHSGVILDLELDAFESAEVTKRQDATSMLVMHLLDGERITFWTAHTAAGRIVAAVSAARR
jgi:hypothetical protein